MGMTISQKILAYHANKEYVEPGELINCRVDVILGNDVTAPVAISEFSRLGLDRVHDPDSIVLVPDHFTPTRILSRRNRPRWYGISPAVSE